MTQSAIPFDTHRFIRNLVAGGFTEKQAEALAYEQVSLLNSSLATKTDVEAIRADVETLRLSTEAKIEEMRLSTEAKIEELRLSTGAETGELRLSTGAETGELRLSTEAKIEELRLSTEAKIEELRLSTEAKIEAAKYELLKWVIGAMIVQSATIVGLTVALNKLL